VLAWSSRGVRVNFVLNENLLIRILWFNCITSRWSNTLQNQIMYQ